MPFVKGQSGNPGGRQRLTAEAKEAIQSNADKARQRMTEILDDDTAFGKEGWLDNKTQLALLEKAMDRGYGKSENLSISHSHSHIGRIEHKAEPIRPDLRTIQGRVPEKQGQTIEGKATKVER